MIFSREVDDAIIKIVAENGFLTVFELHNELWDMISLPQLYKKIQSFVDNHILVKESKKISLNKKWILEYINLWKTIESTYLNKSIDISWLEEWKLRKYTAWSLYELDGIWASLLAELNIYYEYDKVNYSYDSHAYHIIGMRKVNEELFDNIWKRNATTFYLLWNDTMLDQYWVSLLTQLSNTIVLADVETKLLKQWYFLNVIWDYYLEVLLPKALNDYFELIFSTTSSMKEFNLQLFEQIFHMKIPVSLTLVKNAISAKQFANEIELSFKKEEWRKTKK